MEKEKLEQTRLARFYQEKVREKLMLHGQINKEAGLDSDGNPQHYDFSEEFYEVGDNWQQAGCYDKAARFFERAPPEYFAEIGSSFNLQGRQDIAEHFYKKAVEYHESQGISEIDWDRALAYESVGQLDKAYTFFYKKKYEEIEESVHYGCYNDYHHTDKNSLMYRLDNKLMDLRNEMFRRGIKTPDVETSVYEKEAYDRYYFLNNCSSG